MEHVFTIMSIIDENKEKLREGDYVKLCRSMRELYATQSKSKKKPKLSLNRKMSILLQYLYENDPEYMPILSRPYTSDNLRYTEYLCSHTTDVASLYNDAAEHMGSTHYQLL